MHSDIVTQEDLDYHQIFLCLFALRFIPASSYGLKWLSEIKKGDLLSLNWIWNLSFTLYLKIREVREEKKENVKKQIHKLIWKVIV